MNSNTIKRLSFIKYLHEQAIDSLKLPEPMCYSGILSLQDSIELFLQLAAEEKNVVIPAKASFMDYWSAFEKSSLPLPQKVSMERLNKARVGLKHSGLFPQKGDLMDFIVSSKLFFDESSTLIFSKSFKEISLVDFISSDLVKKSIEAAQIHRSRGEYLEATSEYAVGFEILIDEYESKMRSDRGQIGLYKVF